MCACVGMCVPVSACVSVCGRVCACVCVCVRMCARLGHKGSSTHRNKTERFRRTHKTRTVLEHSQKKREMFSDTKKLGDSITPKKVYLCCRPIFSTCDAAGQFSLGVIPRPTILCAPGSCCVGFCVRPIRPHTHTHAQTRPHTHTFLRM